MLDFQKLLAQIQDVRAESVNIHEQSDVLIKAQSTLDEALESASAFQSRLEQNEFLAYWPVALPLEPVGVEYPVREQKQPYTVVAADGSQIIPSHHEVFNCYLLNMGTTMISYGVKLPAKLESHPRLYHRSEDLYPLIDRRRVHVDELYVSLERNLLELSTIHELAIQASERGLPVVAFVDGSLIPWSLDKMPADYQVAYITAFAEILQSLKHLKIPLVGYISHSRSSDLINALRIFRCPYPVSQCHNFCGKLNEEQFPCSDIWPLTDRQLLSGNLDRYKRSCAFLSGAKIARALPETHQICFTYINAGPEIARLELPRYVFEDDQMMHLAAGVAIDQAHKGAGYPVALAEAHNQAVIRGMDRTKFFQLLTRHLVGQGVRHLRLSPKETRKRRGII